MIQLSKNLIYFLIIVMTSIALYFIILLFGSFSDPRSYEYLNGLFVCLLTIAIMISVYLRSNHQGILLENIKWLCTFLLIIQAIFGSFFILKIVQDGFYNSGMPLYYQISTFVLALATLALSIQTQVNVVNKVR